MSHQICLKLPLFCFVVFSMIVGREQKETIPEERHSAKPPFESSYMQSMQEPKETLLTPEQSTPAVDSSDLHLTHDVDPSISGQIEGVQNQNVGQHDLKHLADVSQNPNPSETIAVLQNNELQNEQPLEKEDILEAEQQHEEQEIPENFQEQEEQRLETESGKKVEEELPQEERIDSLNHQETNEVEEVASDVETTKDNDEEIGIQEEKASTDSEYITHTHPPKVNPLLERPNSDHDDMQFQKCYQGDDDNDIHVGFWEPVVLKIRRIFQLVIGFLPIHMQSKVLHIDAALIFTAIVALTLISICVPYFFIEAFLSVRPLKKKVMDLNKTLWKVNTALANQQSEYDAYKEKALLYDEDKKQLEKLETELYLVKQIEVKLKTENRTLKKRINNDVKVAEELEALITATINQRDEILADRNKLRSSLASLQTKFQETVDQLESVRTLDAGRQMDMELLKHSKDNLELRLLALEKEAGELKVKLSSEVELRRCVQAQNDALTLEKNSAVDELLDLKSVLHKYETTVNDLNDEISAKEDELMALKESLGEESPLLDIAEISGKLKGLTGKASSLQARIESLTLENSSLTRELEMSRDSLVALQTEKDTAETRLSVLEAYFKEKEEELRRVVEKHEAEKELRGKDKDELGQIIQENNELVQHLNGMLEKLNQELTETKLAHRTEVRALEAKTHETWLSLCQSERKAQEVRKESELLRQKLTSIAKTKQADGNDSTNGDMPYIFDELDLEDVPLPLPDEPVIPSYFGLGDFEPPAPLDEDENEIFDLHMNGKPHEPPRPPPLGQISPNYSDPEEEADLSPVRGLGGRTEFSADGSFSRRRQPLSTSSPYEHGLNL